MYNMRFSRIQASQHENGVLADAYCPLACDRCFCEYSPPHCPCPPPHITATAQPPWPTPVCVYSLIFIWRAVGLAHPNFFFLNFLFLQLAPHFCRRGFPYEFRGLFGWKPSETSLSRSGSMPIKLGDDGYWVPNLLVGGGGVILSFYEYQKFERPGEFTEGIRHEIIDYLPKSPRASQFCIWW